jgi:hypothetical protein
MHTDKRRSTAWFLVIVGSAGILAATPSRARAEEPATSGLSAAEYDRLTSELQLKNQPWAAIPWRVSVTEARQVAAREHKPIFLVVNTGNCLGWT